MTKLDVFFFHDNRFELEESIDISGPKKKRKSQGEKGSKNNMPGEFGYIDVEFHADFKSAEIFEIGCTVFAQSSIQYFKTHLRHEY